MATEAREALIADLIISTLSGIGPVGATWVTNPYDAVMGAPPDRMPVLDRPRLFVMHAATTARPETASVSGHGMRSLFVVYIAASEHRTVLNVKRDCALALRLAEEAFQTAFGLPAWESEFTHSDAMLASGVYIGLLTLAIDYETDHSTV